MTDPGELIIPLLVVAVAYALYGLFALGRRMSGGPGQSSATLPLFLHVIGILAWVIVVALAFVILFWLATAEPGDINFLWM